MTFRRTILIFLAASLVGCNADFKSFDFDSLPEEYINLDKVKELPDSAFVPLVADARISSRTNKFAITKDVLKEVKGMLGDSKEATSMEVAGTEWNDLVSFMNGVIENDTPNQSVHVKLSNGDHLFIKHIASEIAVFEEVRFSSKFRYTCYLKYHFQVALNGADQYAQAMKHLVYIDDCVVESKSDIY